MVIVKIIFISIIQLGILSAVDINTGEIIWQLPTQSSKIKDKTYAFSLKIVSDGESVIFLK